MASLPGLLESFTVENRLLPVIMMSLPVSSGHFLFITGFLKSLPVDNRPEYVSIASLPVSWNHFLL